MRVMFYCAEACCNCASLEGRSTGTARAIRGIGPAMFRGYLSLAFSEASAEILLSAWSWFRAPALSLEAVMRASSLQQ